MKHTSTKKTVLIALFAALTAAATMFVRIPLPLGYLHLGDAFVLLSAFFLPPLSAALAAGIGSALADLFGYPIYAPGTLLIKAAMALTAGLIHALLFRKTRRTSLSQLCAGMAGTCLMALGYFGYEIILFGSATAAAANLPWSLVQGVSGTVLAASAFRLFSVAGGIAGPLRK